LDALLIAAANRLTHTGRKAVTPLPPHTAQNRRGTGFKV
jgi:hypothetical protein